MLKVVKQFVGIARGESRVFVTVVVVIIVVVVVIVVVEAAA